MFLSNRFCTFWGFNGNRSNCKSCPEVVSFRKVSHLFNTGSFFGTINYSFNNSLICVFLYWLNDKNNAEHSPREHLYPKSKHMDQITRKTEMSSKYSLYRRQNHSFIDIYAWNESININILLNWGVVLALCLTCLYANNIQLHVKKEITQQLGNMAITWYDMIQRDIVVVFSGGVYCNFSHKSRWTTHTVFVILTCEMTWL